MPRIGSFGPSIRIKYELEYNHVIRVAVNKHVFGETKLGNLSTRVFETRTATGSELFPLLTCPHTTTFTLLSIFSPLEMNSIKIWETIRSKNANCSLPVAVRVSKTRVLKLPNIHLPSRRLAVLKVYSS